MTKRKRRTSSAGPQAPVSGPELELWTRTPNLRIRAGRAVQAVAQAMSMMYRQAREAEARHQTALRDAQEQTAQQIADWLAARYASDENVTWKSNVAEEAAEEIKQGAWLPQEQDESDLLTNGPRDTGVVTEVQNPHPQPEPSGGIIAPEPRPLVVL